MTFLVANRDPESLNITIRFDLHPIYGKIEDFQFLSTSPGMTEFALHEADQTKEVVEDWAA